MFSIITTYGLVTYTNTYSVLHECSLLLDKYGTAYGLVTYMYTLCIHVHTQGFI